MVSGDDTYVHDPGAIAEGTDADDAGEIEAATGRVATDDEGLGRSGWVLVGIVAFAFFVAPALILIRPPGVPFRVALLVLPLAPAALLGAVAVWAGIKEA
ncbi:hypothetical protein BRD17_09000 [Halobacteriales archaeon SW_7_68_16]|nr:MAG: hypothetical protein BRD17_09000 [Halobacteriales archaeon SW_7_68_16]